MGIVNFQSLTSFCRELADLEAKAKSLYIEQLGPYVAKKVEEYSQKYFEDGAKGFTLEVCFDKQKSIIGKSLDYLEDDLKEAGYPYLTTEFKPRGSLKLYIYWDIDYLRSK